MSTQIQLTNGQQAPAPKERPEGNSESPEGAGKPTVKEVEKALINVLKAGIYYNKPKDGKFMISYNERVEKLRQAEDPNEYIIELARKIFPNESQYHRVIDDYKTW